MSITTPSIQPIHDGADAAEHVAHVLAARWRRQPHQPVHQRLGSDRHVVRGDQDQDERAEDARHVQADRGERPDQAVGLVGVALDEVLDLVADLAGALAGHVGVDLLEVLDDRGHVVHELVRLVDERRDQQVDDAARARRCRRAGSGARRPGAGSGSARSRRAAAGERDRHDHGHEDRQQQRHELAEEQAEEEQPGREQHRPVDDLRADEICSPRSSRDAYGTPPERQTGAARAPVQASEFRSVVAVRCGARGRPHPAAFSSTRSCASASFSFSSPLRSSRRPSARSEPSPGDVAGCLLGTARDLVDDAHV